VRALDDAADLVVDLARDLVRVVRLGRELAAQERLAVVVAEHAWARAPARQLDRLAVAMEQMANPVADWCGEPSAIVDENALPPEARALRWHLQSVADKLRDSELACASSRDWTRRLLGNPPKDR